MYLRIFTHYLHVLFGNYLHTSALLSPPPLRVAGLLMLGIFVFHPSIPHLQHQKNITSTTRHSSRPSVVNKHQSYKYLSIQKGRESILGRWFLHSPPQGSLDNINNNNNGTF